MAVVSSTNILQHSEKTKTFALRLRLRLGVESKSVSRQRLTTISSPELTEDQKICVRQEIIAFFYD